jgi:hypothetical protein
MRLAPIVLLLAATILAEKPKNLTNFEDENIDHVSAFVGGSECFIRNKKFPNDFLYPVNQFMQGISVYRTVCLKSLKELDKLDTIMWRIDQADKNKDTFHLKMRSNGKDEYLCSLTSLLDVLTKKHELKRLVNLKKVKKENCEWKIEPSKAENTDSSTLLYTIRNQAHGEPIFADSTAFYRNCS